MKQIYVLLILSVLIISCETESEITTDASFINFDTVCPVITLAGNSNDTAYLYANYTDPGAGIHEKINEKCGIDLAKVTGTVDTRFAGKYLLHYNGKDEAGNRATTVTRTVTVVENKAGFLNGAYNVNCTCSAIKRGTLTPTVSTENYTATITTGATNKHFELTALNIGADYVQPYNSSLSGNSMNLTFYSSYCDLRSTATATLSASKNSFTVESTAYRFSPNITYFCKNVYSKQLVLN